jgi:hypothetical protein
MAEQSIRYQSLPLSSIDEEFVGTEVARSWRESNDDRELMLSRREDYTADWRDLSKQESTGPWDDSSNFSHPIVLTTGKAIHARLWQLFSDINSMFGVHARKRTFEDKEETVRRFMNWVLSSYANSKHGVRDTFDEWLWQVVFDGSDYLKLGWMIEEHEFLDVVPVVNQTEVTSFDARNLTGRTDVDTQVAEEEQVVTEVVETPFIHRVDLEDVVLPIGQNDPQTSDWAQHRVWLSSQRMKEHADSGKFDRDAVDFALKHFHVMRNGTEDEIKEMRNQLDGYDYPAGYVRDSHETDGKHAIIEHYGRFHVERKHDIRVQEKISKKEQEIVVWVHQATRKVLGWTYLYRISPSGIRTIFRGDFIRFPNRSHGVGVAEALAQIKQALDAVYNLRQDAGILSSTPTGAYRPSTGLKPDKLKVSPGQLIPLDNPQTDVQIFSFPFNGNYGYQEEDRLNVYGEKMLNVSDITFGQAPQKVGVFRTASGAEDFQTQTGIQVEIHFDRIARTLSRLFQALFRLVRQRMPETLFYRVTGERGEPIFGQVNRDDLKGEYDFEINVDSLSQSRVEGQQKASLMMSTLINPAFMETGIVTPDNLYHITQNFLRQNRVKRIDNFISKPPQYQGEVITPNERIHMIVAGNFTDPPVEDTVRLQDDHARALQIYDGFKESDNFGLLTTNEQLQALDRVIQKHTQMMAAVQGGGLINRSGTQLPAEGMPAIEATGQAPTEQGPLAAPGGETNGPVF